MIRISLSSARYTYVQASVQLPKLPPRNGDLGGTRKREPDAAPAAGLSSGQNRAVAARGADRS